MHPDASYILKINSLAAARESLEIWGFGGSYYDYWVRGLPHELSSYIQADSWDVADYFLPGLMDIYKIGGKYYRLCQLTCFGSTVVYNRDAFDAAGPNWQVLRVLTSVEATRAYSTNSGTPPTVRDSLDTRLSSVPQWTGQSVEDLRLLTVGGIEKARAQVSPDHLFVQHGRIQDTFDQSIAAL